MHSASAFKITVKGKNMISIGHRTQKKVVIVTFLFIPILLLLTFCYYPGTKLIQQSFTDWDGMSWTYNNIGFDNYRDVLKSEETYYILSNNLIYFVAAFIQIVLGLYTAIVLNGKIKGSNFFRAVVFMPYILNTAAVAYMFNFLYNTEHSPINLFLKTIGFGDYAIRFLSNSYWSNLSLSIVGIWSYTGFFMVLYLGALQSIPQTYYEAAEIDGVNFLQKFWYITIPNIKTVIELTIFLGINGSMQTFLQPLLITQGGPGIRTETFVSYTLKVAFAFNNFGKASAMGVLIMLAVILLVGIQQHLLRRQGGDD